MGHPTNKGFALKEVLEESTHILPFAPTLVRGTEGAPLAGVRRASLFSSCHPRSKSLTLTARLLPRVLRHEEKRGGEGRVCCLETVSSRPICPHPAETMPSLGTICSLLLLSVLWVDLAMAGSSFLSPEHQKVQVRYLPHRAPHSDWGNSFQPCHIAVGCYDLGSGSTSMDFSFLLEHKRGLWV